MVNLTSASPSVVLAPRFHVVFSSAYFRLYVESSPYNWRLVRHQTEEPVRPVLLFRSMRDAESYATSVLGLSAASQYAPTERPRSWLDISRTHHYEAYSDDTQAPMLTKVYEPAAGGSSSVVPPYLSETGEA